MESPGWCSLVRPAPPKARPVRSEQIILFRVSSQIFAISSASVQEVRSVDSLAGAATEIVAPGIRKVRQILQRGDKSLYVVNGAIHFGLPLTSGALIFVLRNTRIALLIDAIEKMTSMTQLQVLPNAFCHEERQWYRGLTALDQTVLPVVNPNGFLTSEELEALDACILPPRETSHSNDTASPANAESFHSNETNSSSNTDSFRSNEASSSSNMDSFHSNGTSSSSDANSFHSNASSFNAATTNSLDSNVFHAADSNPPRTEFPS